ILYLIYPLLFVIIETFVSDLFKKNLVLFYYRITQNGLQMLLTLSQFKVGQVDFVVHSGFFKSILCSKFLEYRQCLQFSGKRSLVQKLYTGSCCVSEAFKVLCKSEMACFTNLLDDFSFYKVGNSDHDAVFQQIYLYRSIEIPDIYISHFIHIKPVEYFYHGARKCQIYCSIMLL